jgi:ipoprotein LpqH
VTRHLPALAIAAIAAIVGILLSSCSPNPPPPARSSGGLAPNTARVVVDGKDLGTTDVVCSQTGWTWIITADDHGSSSTAVIETGGPLVARSVRFRQVDGFSGSYWDGNHGRAEARVVAGNWTVTGTIDGFNTDTSGIDRATKQFTFTANC